jgi:hypothetical protein
MARRWWSRGTLYPTEGGRWSWDYPTEGSSVRGRTLIVDGWVADWPPNAEIVLVSTSTILAASEVRHPRPDVASAHSLREDAVGFHIEADISSVDSANPMRVALGIREPGGLPRILGTRTFHLADREPLPYS